MELLIIFSLILVVCFSVVLIFGAPFLPTHKPQVDIALDLLEMKPGQKLYELGCGDGRLLVAAAKRGYRAVGYEMNPIMYVWTSLNTWRYRSLVEVKLGNFWKANLSDADGVYVFLLDRFMNRLDNKLISELRPGVRLASYTFKIPGKNTTSEKSGVFVYEY